MKNISSIIFSNKNNIIVIKELNLNLQQSTYPSLKIVCIKILFKDFVSRILV